jgi:hypothetical protein
MPGWLSIRSMDLTGILRFVGNTHFVVSPRRDDGMGRAGGDENINRVSQPIGDRLDLTRRAAAQAAESLLAERDCEQAAR